MAQKGTNLREFARAYGRGGKSSDSDEKFMADEGKGIVKTAESTKMWGAGEKTTPQWPNQLKDEKTAAFRKRVARKK